MTEWLLYSIAWSAVLSCAALLMERAVHLYRLPTRWIWSTALALSAGIPFALRLLPTRTNAPASSISFGPMVMGAGPVDSDGFSVAERVRELVSVLDPVLPLLWLCASTLLLIHVFLSLLELHRRKRGWQRASLLGQPVLISSDVGPAVMGTFQPIIVLPEWVLGWSGSMQCLIMRHEREHLRAGDQWLRSGALAAVVLMPLNLPLWWQTHRLRLAVEVDCDARVLRGGADVRMYGSLLLEVGCRASVRGFAMAGLSERTSFLERRLHLMSATIPRRRAAQAAGFVGLAAIATVAACELPEPPRRTATEVPSVRTVPLPEIAREPTFTPYTRAPQMQNRDQLVLAVQSAYPPELREAGVGGTVRVWVFVDESGRVRNTRVVARSGYAELDEAAERAVRAARFTPAMNRGQPVGVWIQFPITFQRGGGSLADRELSDPPARAPLPPLPPAGIEREPAPLPQSDVPPVPIPNAVPPEQRRSPPNPPPGSSRESPTFTPYEVAPELRNPQVLVERIRELYPQVLREAGVGGTVRVWVFIDRNGEVQQTRVAESSGRPELDTAAEEAMRAARFAPALNRDEKVAVWVQFPITFQPPEPSESNPAAG